MNQAACRKIPVQKIIFLFFILSLILQACSSPTPVASTEVPLTATNPPSLEPTSTPPAYPSVSPTPLSSESPPTDIPTSTSNLTETSEPTQPAITYTNTPRWVIRTRTSTSTPTPSLADIRITRPGLASRVLSPFRLEANALVGSDGRVHLALIGEDGNLLVESSLRYSQYTGSQAFIQEEVKFQISGAAEAARLVLYSLDRFNRIIALSSVDLILLAMGEEQINPPVNLRTPFFIIRPYLNESFKGGILKVNGMISPVSNQPVILEAVDETGTIILSTTLDAGPVTAERLYAPFEIEVPYTVSRFTRVRLVLRQETDNRIPGTVALVSVPISLSP